MTKLYLYDNWRETTDNFARPFKRKGHYIKVWYLDDIKLNLPKIVNWWLQSYLAAFAKRANKKLLVIFRGDYENAFIGNKSECWEYIKDCLTDLEIMSKRRARKQIMVV